MHECHNYNIRESVHLFKSWKDKITVKNALGITLECGRFNRLVTVKVMAALHTQEVSIVYKCTRASECAQRVQGSAHVGPSFRLVIRCRAVGQR